MKHEIDQEQTPKVTYQFEFSDVEGAFEITHATVVNGHHNESPAIPEPTKLQKLAASPVLPGNVFSRHREGEPSQGPVSQTPRTANIAEYTRV